MAYQSPHTALREESSQHIVQNADFADAEGVLVGDDPFSLEDGDPRIDEVVAAIALKKSTPFTILTKHPKRMHEYFCCDELAPLRVLVQQVKSTADAAIVGDRVSIPWPVRNLWLGVVASDQAEVDAGMAHLAATPAEKRVLFLQPLRRSVDLSQVLPCLDWVIVGGDDGPSNIRCDIKWIRSVVAQCRGAGKPVFVTQLGSNVSGFWCRMCRGWADPNNDSWWDPIHPWEVVKYCGPLLDFAELHDRAGRDVTEWPVDVRVQERPLWVRTLS